MMGDTQNHDAYEKSEENDKNAWMTWSHIIIILFVQKITSVLYKVISVFSKVTSVLYKVTSIFSQVIY